MAVLNRDDFFARLHSKLAEDTSEDGIAFLEDMTDTYDDLERRANGDGIDWESRYHDLDESWKKRYRHRFFTGSGGNPSYPESAPDDNEYDPNRITINDLFSKKEMK